MQLECRVSLHKVHRPLGCVAASCPPGGAELLHTLALNNTRRLFSPAGLRDTFGGSDALIVHAGAADGYRRRTMAHDRRSAYLTPPPLLPSPPLPSPRLPSPSLAVYLVPLTLQRSPLPPAVAYELIIGAKHWTAI